jgi:phosphoribosyl-ATP pyrophosphohydrolase
MRRLFVFGAGKRVNEEKIHPVYSERMNDSLERLYAQVTAARTADPAHSRTAKLMRAGRAKMAKKFAEEAIEVVIDAMNGEREAVVRESADLLYNLVVLWAEAGVRPQDVFAEMARRERLFGLAEKVPKKHIDANGGRRKVVLLEARRKSRRR